MRFTQTQKLEFDYERLHKDRNKDLESIDEAEKWRFAANFADDDVVIRTVKRRTDTERAGPRVKGEGEMGVPRAVHQALETYNTDYVVAERPYAFCNCGMSFGEDEHFKDLENLTTVPPASMSMKQPGKSSSYTTSSLRRLGGCSSFRAVTAKGEPETQRQDDDTKTRQEGKTGEGEKDNEGDSSLDDSQGGVDELLLDRIEKPVSDPEWTNKRPLLSHVLDAPSFSRPTEETALLRPTAHEHPFEPQCFAQIMVDVRSLQFECAQFEPLYGTLFLYNKTTNSITSEMFHFDVNPAHLRMIGNRSVEDTTKRSTVIFNIPLPQNKGVGTDGQGRVNLTSSPTSLFDDFIVLKVEKIYQNNALSKVCDKVYGKHEGGITSLEADKLKKQVALIAQEFFLSSGRQQEQRPESPRPATTPIPEDDEESEDEDVDETPEGQSLQTLGKTREQRLTGPVHVPKQTIAWSCLPIYRVEKDENDQCVLNVCEGERVFSSFFKHSPTEQDILGALMSCSTGSSKKLSPLYGSCSVIIRNIGVSTPTHKNFIVEGITDEKASPHTVFIDSSHNVLAVEHMQQETKKKSERRKGSDKKETSQDALQKSTSSRKCHKKEESAGGDARIVQVLSMFEEGEALFTGDEKTLSGQIQQGQAKETCHPFNSTEHNMFVFVRNVMLPSRAGTSKFRQTTLRVQVEFVNDKTHEALPVFDCFEQDQRMDTKGFTSCTLHSGKVSNFQDMLRVTPPYTLTEDMYLLFTVTKISCKKQRLEMNTIGYACTPVFLNSELVTGKQLTLPVTREKPDSLSTWYKAQFGGESGTETTQVTSSIKIGILWNTTLYSQDQHIQHFFSSLNTADDKHLSMTKECLSNLHKAAPSALVNHLPLILNELFSLMARSPLHAESFHSLLTVLKTLEKSKLDVSQDKLLNTYLMYHFLSNSHKDEACILSHQIVKSWYATLEETNKPLHTELCAHAAETSCKFSMFLFGAIAKSLALCTPFKTPREDRFQNEVYQDIEALLTELRGAIGRDYGEIISVSVGCFFQCLLALMDRGLVLSMARRFIESIGTDGMDNSAIASRKLMFLRVLCQYENNVPLNMPTPPGNKVKQLSVEPVDSQWLKQNSDYAALPDRKPQFFLADILLHHVDFYLDKRFYSAKVRELSMTSLRNMFIKYDMDERLSDPTLKAAVACMYLPFMNIFIKRRELFDTKESDSSPELRKAALFCFLWLLKHCDKSEVARWISSGRDTLHKATTLFEVMQAAAETFSFQSTISGANGSVLQSAAHLSFNNKNERTNKAIQGSTETALIELLSLRYISAALCSNSDTRSFDTYGKVLEVLSTHLSHSCTQELDDFIYLSIHAFISNDAEHECQQFLFVKQNDCCAQLCKTVMWHCNSPNIRVRSAATAFLYFLILQNSKTQQSSLKATTTFDRTRVQTMIGLSKLVGKRTNDVKYIRRSLSTLMRYNELLNGRLVTYEEWVSEQKRIAEQARQREAQKQKRKAAAEAAAAALARDEYLGAEETTESTDKLTESTEKVPTKEVSSEKPKSPENPTEGQQTQTSGVETTKENTQTSMQLNTSVKTGRKTLGTSRRLFLKTELCYACQTPVISIEKIEVDGHAFHPNCFRCSICNQLLRNIYFPVLGRYYCKKDYQEHFNSRRTRNPLGRKQTTATETREMKPLTKSEGDTYPEEVKEKQKESDGQKQEEDTKTSTNSHEDSVPEAKGSESGPTLGRSFMSDSEDGDRYVFNDFGRAISELVERLTMILLDLMKLNRYSDDPEMTTDLYLNIANSYVSVPAIRLAWLDSLFEKNMDIGALIEAALVRVHECAFIAEYIYLRTKRENKSVPYLPAGWKAFQKLTLNSKDESCLMGLLKDGDMLSNSEEFTEQNLIARMEETTNLLLDAELYEVAYQMMLLLIPVYEHYREYRKLDMLFRDLQHVSQQISSASRSLPCMWVDKQGHCENAATFHCTACGWFCEKHCEELHKHQEQMPLCFLASTEHNITSQVRLLGIYYRVALYGQVFEEQNGREYITRQSQVVRLPQLQDMLLKKYKQHYAETLERTGGKITVYREAGDVPESCKNDAINGYIQLNQVEPYFGSEKQRNHKRAEGSSEPLSLSRETSFEKFYNVTTFMYDSPFTKNKDGSKHNESDLTKQWKKRTFLHSEKAFPFMKQRLYVQRHETVEINPLECAIETMDMQNTRLRTELDTVDISISGPEVAQLKRRLRDTTDERMCTILQNEIQMREFGGRGAVATPDLRTLQSILQGTCVTMVQQGATEGICKGFLENTIREWPRGDIERLIDALTAFLSTVKEAVKVHERYCPPEQADLHTQITKGFAQMQSDITRMMFGAKAELKNAENGGHRASRTYIRIDHKPTTNPHGTPAALTQSNMSTVTTTPVLPEQGTRGTVGHRLFKSARRTATEHQIAIPSQPTTALTSTGSDLDGTKKHKKHGLTVHFLPQHLTPTLKEDERHEGKPKSGHRKKTRRSKSEAEFGQGKDSEGVVLRKSRSKQHKTETSTGDS